MRNIKLIISYDGTDFFGWQRQPGRRTVQDELDAAIRRLTGSSPMTVASSRTDAGVHAAGQVIQFFTVSRHSVDTFVKGLNALLPPDIRVLEAHDMPQSFHATVDARSKRYRYLIENARVPSPFTRRYSWHVFHPLDADAMHEAGQSLVGRHDFHSFETNWPNRLSSVRTVYELIVKREDNVVSIEVEANGFLYNMVRTIAGTLVAVGNGKNPVGWVADVLAAEDRTRAGVTAPPSGLLLLYVRFEPTAINTR